MLYQFKIKFRKKNTEMRNCKVNVRTSGCGKSCSPPVHLISQLSTSATRPRLVTCLLIFLVKRTRINLSRPSCTLMGRRQSDAVLCSSAICPRRLTCTKSINPNIGRYFWHFWASRCILFIYYAIFV